jgi:hypothetical protein
LPGRPLSVYSPKPGSPVRSRTPGGRVMVQPVVSPIRLVPNEVTTPRQSGPIGRDGGSEFCSTLRAITVFCKMVVAPLALRRALPKANGPEPALSASVLWVRTNVAKFAMAVPISLKNPFALFLAKVVLLTTSVPKF